jgi:predicted transposase YdaD
LVSQLLEDVVEMHESTTYQAILREGRKEGLIEGRIAGEQQILIRLGTKILGKPDPGILAAIAAIRDVERLEALGERIIDPAVNDWNTLLGSS